MLKPTTLELLEPRQMLSSAPWSAQDKQINLDQAVANFPNITGAGETVVIIDRGVDYNHPALGGGFGKKIIYEWDYQDNRADVYPYDGVVHGTGTAGQIAADPHVVNGYLYQGVAPGVKLVALKTNSASDIKAAMDWIIANRAAYNIVAVNYLDQAGSNQNVFEWELQTLRNQGVFVAGAVGNYGPGPAYDSVNNLIYEVGAVDKNDQITGFTPRGSAVEMVAPGQQVDITWNQNGKSTDILNDGTSWAGPQVTGTAALIKQINPSFTPPQILQIMRDSAHWVYDSVSNAYYPRLDVNAALALAYQRTAPPKPVTSTPFTGTPFNVGDTIEAENFDNGGEGVAYHDTTSTNEGTDPYRSAAGVDLGWTNADGGSHFVGWTYAGEWINYSINVASSGSYDLAARVSCLGNGGTFHFEVDGQNVTGSITIPNTGSWDAYTTLTKTVSLTAGNHVLRLVMDTMGSGGFLGNFNWFKLTPHTSSVGSGNGGSGADSAQINLAAGSATVSSVNLTWDDTSDGVATFVLERSNKWSGNYSEVATVQAAQPQSRSASSAAGTHHTVTDNNLKSATRYYYRLKVITASATTYTTPVYVSTLSGHHHHHHHTTATAAATKSAAPTVAPTMIFNPFAR
jgi:hypothetical protein